MDHPAATESDEDPRAEVIQEKNASVAYSFVQVNAFIDEVPERDL